MDIYVNLLKIVQYVRLKKSDHTLSRGASCNRLISLKTKWSEISIHFITDLPMSSRSRDSVLVMVDKGYQDGTSDTL